MTSALMMLLPRETQTIIPTLYGAKGSQKCLQSALNDKISVRLIQSVNNFFTLMPQTLQV